MARDEIASPADELRSRLDHYRRLLSADDFARLVGALEQPRLPALRVNPLKIDPARALATWPVWYDWDVQPVPFCATGWQVTRAEVPIAQTLEHHDGYYYVQDAASMIPAELFSAHDAPLILDLAAAPGGKSTHLASRTADRGLIVANDTSTRRITALRANLQNWGVFGALITNFPGERFGGWFPETFDCALVDAPCSGDTLRLTTGRKTRSVSDAEREQLCTRQIALLSSALAAVRPGGEIVYATCTMAPEEDEGVLDDLLRRFPGAVTIEAVEALAHAPGLLSDGARDFDPALRGAIRVWPHLHHTSGFFAARLRKLAPIPFATEAAPLRTWAEHGLRALSQRDVAQIIGQCESAFGFDLGAVLQTYALDLWSRAEVLYAIPAHAQAQFSTLPHAGAGFLLGEWSAGRFVPSHELITRFGDQFSAPRLRLEPDRAALWRQGRDLRGIAVGVVLAGEIVLLEDTRGRFLGRGRAQADRIRNLLPRRLVHQSAGR